MAQTFNDTEVKIKYSVDGLSHRMVLGCKIAGLVISGTEPTFELKGGATQTATLAVTGLVDYIKTLYNNTCTFSDYEIWCNDLGSLGRFYVYGESLGIAGTLATGSKLAWQETLLYRSTNGKVGRLVMLENARDNYGKEARPFGISGENLATFIEGGTSWIYHSSGAFVSTVYALQRTTNNALERKRYNVG